MIVSHPDSVHYEAWEKEIRSLNPHELLARHEHHKRCLLDPSSRESLREEAQRQIILVAEEKEKTVLINATKRRLAIDNAELNDIRQRWLESDRAKRLKNGTPWMIRMLRNGLLEDGVECWGFVVFRTGCYGGEEGEASWRKFRTYFEKVAEVSVLHWNSGPLLWPAFRVVFVEDKELDGASNEKLRAIFKEMRDLGNDERLPNGIRTSCFLVADREVIESEAVKTPYIARYVDDMEASVHILAEDPVVYICVVDPDYQVPLIRREKVGNQGGGPRINRSDELVATTKEELDSEMVDFKGESTVALPRVFDWLHCVCFNTERGIDTTPTICWGKGWHTIHKETMTPEAWIRNLAANGNILYAR
jgi:hypothetical protein